MFKNFQEQFVTTQESQHAAEFRLFNHRQDRLKLIISAILIPVGCSVFYFLFSGHKYAELESAIGDIESVQTSESIASESIDMQDSINNSAQSTNDKAEIQLSDTIDNETPIASDDSINIVDDSASSLTTQPLTSDAQSEPALATGNSTPDTLDTKLTAPELAETIPKPTSLEAEEIFPGRNLTELTELLIADDIFETHTENAYQNSIPGRGQSEVAMLVTQHRDHIIGKSEGDVTLTTAMNSDGTDETYATSLHESDNMLIVSATSKLDHNDQHTNEQKDIHISAESVTRYPHLLPALTAKDTDKITRIASVMQVNNSTDSNADDKATALEHRQRQQQNSKVIMVDKIVGLLKSEIINPNATADTGKLKLTNRHSTTNKKSFDIDKLESMLEDI